MKHLTALFVLAITFFAPALASAADEKVDFEDEFLQGLEAGFFLRNNPTGYLDY